MNDDRLSSVRLATLPFSGFGSSLKSSDDGQFLIITRTYLYLLTPSFNSTSTSTHHHHHHFHKSVIELNKHLGLPWSSHSNDFAIITPSSVDRFWKKATWSPSSLTKLGSCLLVGLTTNGDVYIFIPQKNFQTGLWNNSTQINLSEDLLKYQFERFGDEVEINSSQSIQSILKRSHFTSLILQTQTISLDWSKPIDLIDHELSILALGHRRGDLSLWKHKNQGRMELICFKSICTHSNSITELCWSNWKTLKTENEYVAYLAVANSKGIVYLTRVSREFQSIDSIQINSRSLYHDPTNQSTITAMQWSESPHQPESLALVFTRLGEIILCQISTSGILSSTVSCELPRPDPRLDWAGITNWAPCTGLSTIPILEQTSIIITLFNGLVYVFDYNHTNHHFVCDRFRSFQLSSDLRFRFRKLVGSAVTKQEVMSVYGSEVIGNGRLFSWIFEVDEPNRFRYKPENRQALVFCIAPLGGCDPADELMELLETPKPCYQIAPLKSLLPALFSLEIPNQRLLELLEVDHYLDPKRDDSIGLENKSIQHDLFQNRLMDGLRIKLNLCRFLIDRFQLNLTIHSSDLNDEISGQIVDCYVKIKRRIYCEVIRMIDRFLEGLNPDSLSEFETKMKRRYRLASLVIGNRPEPTLVQLLAPEVPSHRLLDSDRLEGMSLEGEGGMMMMEEECPACERGIGFENLSLGVCERGHVWDRCLISFEVLNDCQLRICEGCDRKVKVRLGDRIEGLVKDRGCLYCGNRWKMN